MPELTTGQVFSFGQEELTPTLPASFATYRTMRKEPTIALARALSVAPVVAGQWTTEADDDAPDDAKEFIEKQMFPHREPLLETSMFGGIDFGWQGYELVFELDPKTGRVVLPKIKALLQDFTIIMVVAQTGAFDGFRQRLGGSDVTLEVEKTLLVPFRVEGTQWYGQSLLENARGAYNSRAAANASSDLYDKKLSGAQHLVEYPMGDGVNEDGEDEANAAIAKRIIVSLRGSAAVAIPVQIAKYVTAANENTPTGWKISILSDNSPKQQSFRDGFEYKDKQFVRALLMPERAILEGQFGTKADAGMHADLALTHMDLTHRHITRLVNWHVVNRLLELNFGPDSVGTVRLVAAPLSNEKLTYYKELLTAFIANPLLAETILGSVDTDSILDFLGLPKRKGELDRAVVVDEPEPDLEEIVGPEEVDVE